MLSISYKDPRPIYEQVRDGLRQLILTGAIAPGEKLPSVRELASQLAINPNTIQRAYRELEHLGLIYTAPGKGAFAGDTSDAARKRQEELLQTLGGTIRELKSIGTAQETISQVLSAIYKEESK